MCVSELAKRLRPRPRNRVFECGSARDDGAKRRTEKSTAGLVERNSFSEKAVSDVPNP